MGSLTFLFHQLLKKFDVEEKLFEKFSINMMRSLICGTIAHEAYQNYSLIWEDKCLDNIVVLNNFKTLSFHNYI